MGWDHFNLTRVWFGGLESESRNILQKWWIRSSSKNKGRGQPRVDPVPSLVDTEPNTTVVSWSHGAGLLGIWYGAMRGYLLLHLYFSILKKLSTGAMRGYLLCLA
jgi:hypothetical protein